MPDHAHLCRHFTHLRNAFHDHGDKLQNLIDEIIAELKQTLVGPFLTRFVEAMDKARDSAERLAVVQATLARLTRLLHSLLGAPIEPWMVEALEMLQQLEALLQTLIVVRAQEEAMDNHIKAWCG